jgi:hypothetical protein
MVDSPTMDCIGIFGSYYILLFVKVYTDTDHGSRLYPSGHFCHYRVAWLIQALISWTEVAAISNNARMDRDNSDGPSPTATLQLTTCKSFSTYSHNKWLE